jgi:hypothetical protein
MNCEKLSRYQDFDCVSFHGAGGGAEPFHGAGGGAEPFCNGCTAVTVFHGAGGGAEPFHGAGGGAEPLAIRMVSLECALSTVFKPIDPVRTIAANRIVAFLRDMWPPRYEKPRRHSTLNSGSVK